MAMGSTTITMEALARKIASFPAIDNHAHNILSASKDPLFPLHEMCGEAAGSAAEDVKYTIPFYRATKQLATLYSCAPDWESVLEARKRLEYEEVCRKCFERSGIQCLLLDDLMLGIEANCEPTSAHDRFTPNPTKRIIRLESVAENIISHIDRSRLPLLSPSVYNDFWKDFKSSITSHCTSPHVIAFKSIACYRTGLDIHPSKDREACYRAFSMVLDSMIEEGVERPRLACKPLNDALVCITLEIAGEYNKPVQFHTGLGDNSLTLLKSSPAHMQSIISAYPETQFVLLHSSYPYTREAGYLTSVYKNVYLDFGEVWPFVSSEGQRGVIREMLELCPTNKIMWSSDGHYWPETFYLGSLQAREALTEVLTEMVLRGDITEHEALGIAERALFHNANKLYGLNLTPIPASTTLTHQGHGHGQASSTKTYGLSRLAALPPSITTIRITWVDLTNTVRFKVIPRTHIPIHKGITLTKALFHVTYGDHLVPSRVEEVVGEWVYVPDLSSLRVCGEREGVGSACVLGYFEGKEGDGEKKCGLDPRAALRDVLIKAKNDYGIEFKVGFETEFILIPLSENTNTTPKVAGWCTNSISAQEHVVLENIQEALTKSGIEVLAWHRESAPMQFEIVTGPLDPLEAADALVLTRETIYAVSERFGYRATLVPKVDRDKDKETAGSATHVHISLKSTRESESNPHVKITPPNGNGHGHNMSPIERSFLQGLLTHLPSISACTLPLPISYTRIIDGAWAGGTWVAWGRDNRECPVRLCGSSSGWNFEVKSMDGTASPYLALAAVVSGGMIGVEGGVELEMRDCRKVPGYMSESERAEWGVTNRMPRSVEEAHEAMRGDEEMGRWMGEELVEGFLDVVKLHGDLLEEAEKERPGSLVHVY